MKSNRYRRLRAKEMALKAFLAGDEANPFPGGTLEHRVFTQEMAASRAFDRDMRDMCAVYGGPLPTLRDPSEINVRPALPGYP